MKKLIFLFLITAACNSTNTFVKNEELSRWEEQAENVTIIRDNYGIPHIYGKTDADVVFGLLYAQCEDDFNRVEVNYINGMGRMAEATGTEDIYKDLRMKLFIDPEDMKQKYNESPEWLKKLMNAFADGINYYLYTHPDTKPKVIEKFEPWMALTFSEGSIGGDIETISISNLESFYGNKEIALAEELLEIDEEPRGSNGISIAPGNTQNGNALFLINPHTSFFFRAEVHMVSEEGLNAYGAVTWGQFFVYQGFNERLGWMHTSSRADAIDEYEESVLEKEDGYYYLYGDEERKMVEKEIIVPYKTETGIAEKVFKGYYTHHGPIIRNEEGKWISIALMQRPVDAIIQSFSRTKASNYDEFYKTMEIRTNSSNNTVYADADGNIAYFHGNFIPKRDPQFDWTKPVDGSNPLTDWQGLHTLEEIVTIKNPENGWIQNCNSTPFTAAGTFSPKKEDYATYIAPDDENFRGIHALRVLEGRKNLTIDSLIKIAYDPYLPGFEKLIPTLTRAYYFSKDKDELTTEAINMLSKWNFEWSEESIPTTVATFWGQKVLRNAYEDPARGEINVYDYMITGTSAETKLSLFKETLTELKNDFGDWKTPWGEVNRYQRLNGDIQQDFNDNEKSLPVAFASGRWGSLASFGARVYPQTKKMYGTSGNSFVAFVEFGEKLKAKSISTGGINSNPDSPHFDDQALMYTKGIFKEVNFYRADVERNAEKTYSPGAEQEIEEN